MTRGRPMMQSQRSSSVSRRVLIIDGALAEHHSVAATRVRNLEEELKSRGIEVVEAIIYDDGFANIESDASLLCILLAWKPEIEENTGATKLLQATHRRN